MNINQYMYAVKLTDSFCHCNMFRINVMSWTQVNYTTVCALLTEEVRTTDDGYPDGRL